MHSTPIPIIGQNSSSSAHVIDGSLRFNDVNQHLTRRFQLINVEI